MFLILKTHSIVPTGNATARHGAVDSEGKHERTEISDGSSHGQSECGDAGFIDGGRWVEDSSQVVSSSLLFLLWCSIWLARSVGSTEYSTTYYCASSKAVSVSVSSQLLRSTLVPSTYLYSQLLLYRTRLYRNWHIPDYWEFQSRAETAHSMVCTVRLFGYTGFLIDRILKILVPTPVRYKNNWL